MCDLHMEGWTWPLLLSTPSVELDDHHLHCKDNEAKGFSAQWESQGLEGPPR